MLPIFTRFRDQTLIIMIRLATILWAEVLEHYEDKNAEKIQFLTWQMELLADKKFISSHYCFAVESFPRCSYEQLREVLVLPSKRKIQSIVSSVNINQVLEKTSNKIQNDHQKNPFLIIDEVKIRPSVAYSSGELNGMSKNDPDSKATSMLCVMLKWLHRGPSTMVSITPVHKLTSAYQF